MPDVKRAMIIGLDCAEPSLVLGRFRDQVPTLSAGQPVPPAMRGASLLERVTA